ncbi:MAG TPA: hypothetical protein VFK50_08750 [Sphingomicrobium sp.]|nr:hypothetical protein [Sphingomicrobium sp.]
MPRAAPATPPTPDQVRGRLLNQVTNVSGGTPTHDANGNLAFDPVTGRAYA